MWGQSHLRSRKCPFAAWPTPRLPLLPHCAGARLPAVPPGGARFNSILSFLATSHPRGLQGWSTLWEVEAPGCLAPPVPSTPCSGPRHTLSELPLLWKEGEEPSALMNERGLGSCP